MKLHGGPNLARGPEFDTHDVGHGNSPYCIESAPIEQAPIQISRKSRISQGI